MTYAPLIVTNFLLEDARIIQTGADSLVRLIVARNDNMRRVGTRDSPAVQFAQTQKVVSTGLVIVFAVLAVPVLALSPDTRHIIRDQMRPIGLIAEQTRVGILFSTTREGAKVTSFTSILFQHFCHLFILIKLTTNIVSAGHVDTNLLQFGANNVVKALLEAFQRTGRERAAATLLAVRVAGIVRPQVGGVFVVTFNVLDSIGKAVVANGTVVPCIGHSQQVEKKQDPAVVESRTEETTTKIHGKW